MPSPTDKRVTTSGGAPHGAAQQPAPQATAAGRIARVALLAALALIFSYVEAIIPYTPAVPGIKLGVANLVVIIALYRYGARDALLINLVRIVIAGLLFNGLFGMLYSLAGAAVSLLGMIALKKAGPFSVAGVSMAGGVLHNLGQLIVAALLIEDVRIFGYFPVLMFSGIVSGIAIGVLAHIVLARLSRI
ncbi:MAG: Gx transporter family protein [Mogibacterium sp.]|nr:Gx transporter family protein [Mogibacterium sp.]